MDKSGFWQLIATIDHGALGDGDDEAAIEPLIDALAVQNEIDIQEFEDILSQCLYDIDGRAYADEAGESGRSGDGFLYARCYVVAKGQKYYESVRVDPSKMPKSLDEWCESLLYAAQRAWAAATGNDEETWDYHAPVSYETGSNTARWP